MTLAARSLTAAVAAVDEPAWVEQLAPLAHLPVSEAAGRDGPPTYHEVVSAGLGLVTALVDEQRWGPARSQVELLAEWCARHRKALHPVAIVAFEGLEEAVRARDIDETIAHLELLDELFPGPEDPP